MRGRFESVGTGDSSRGRTESGRVGKSIQVDREARGRRERERGKSGGGRRCFEEGGGDRPEPMESERGMGVGGGGVVVHGSEDTFSPSPRSGMRTGRDLLELNSSMNEESEAEQR